MKQEELYNNLKIKYDNLVTRFNEVNNNHKKKIHCLEKIIEDTRLQRNVAEEKTFKQDKLYNQEFNKVKEKDDLIKLLLDSDYDNIAKILMQQPRDYLLNQLDIFAKTITELQEERKELIENHKKELAEKHPKKFRYYESIIKKLQTLYHQLENKYYAECKLNSKQKTNIATYKKAIQDLKKKITRIQKEKKIKAIENKEIDINDLPIDELPLPIRAITMMKCEKIDHIHELLKYSEDDLYRIENVGRTTIRAIQKFLRQHDLKLKENNYGNN